MISPVHSHYHEGSPMSKEEKLSEKDFFKKLGFSAWSERVMDDESSDGGDGLISGWGGESRQEWLGWRNESVIWFQRLDDAYLNEGSVIFNEEMVGGRERVTTDEERVLWGGWMEIRL